MHQTFSQIIYKATQLINVDVITCGEKIEYKQQNSFKNTKFLMKNKNKCCQVNENSGEMGRFSNNLSIVTENMTH